MVAYMESRQRKVAKTATQGKAAIRGGRAARYFGARLRDERERRGWTQVEMARRLGEAGWPVNATVLAKVESTKEDVRRSVNIDEAMACAEVLGMSLDTLLGRVTHAESDEELENTLETFLIVAHTLFPKQAEIREMFRIRMADLEPLEFEGRDLLDLEVKQAWLGIDLAAKSLAGIAAWKVPSDLKVTLRDQFTSGGPQQERSQ
jgi:transcriptional regulator with XRE-family HTH domain